MLKSSPSTAERSLADMRGGLGRWPFRTCLAWKAHRLEDAAKLYRGAVDMRPAWAEGWGFLASSLYQLERYPEARDAYRETTILTPKNANATSTRSSSS